jgi:hypothetical protein
MPQFFKRVVATVLPAYSVYNNIPYRENITHITVHIVCQQKQEAMRKFVFLITDNFDVTNKTITVFKQCFSYMNIIIVITAI